MARYNDAVCRICRREGLKLFLKGSRCYSRKCAFERRSTPPGMNTMRRRKVSEYGLQLREKQKLRKSYSVLERQFRNYFEKADQRKGVTGENLVRMLEMRLDNVVFRMGFASSRARRASSSATATSRSTGRRPTSRASRPRSATASRFARAGAGVKIFKVAAETMKAAQIPEWVSVDPAKLSGSVLSEPAREQMPLEFNEQLVVEYYSR